jgi:hypothetical protein
MTDAGTASRKVVGFGVWEGIDEHKFRVELPRTALVEVGAGNVPESVKPRDGWVTVIEDFGAHGRSTDAYSGKKEREVLRARIPFTVWQRIRPALEHSFNERLRGESQPVWAFSRDTRTRPRRYEHFLSPRFGGELCVLLWALEDAANEQARTKAINTWRHMRPEIRSWFFSNAVRYGGRVEDSLEGWRAGIRSIFQTEYVRGSDSQKPTKRTRKREYKGIDPLQQATLNFLITEGTQNHE